MRLRGLSDTPNPIPFTTVDWINMGPDNRRYQTGEYGANAANTLVSAMNATQRAQLNAQDAAYAATGYQGPIAPPGNPPVAVNIPASAYGNTQTDEPDESNTPTGNTTMPAPLYTATQWVGLSPSMRDAIRPTLTQAQAVAIWNSMSAAQQAQVTAENNAWLAEGHIAHPAGSAIDPAEPSTGEKVLKYGALALGLISLFK